MTQTRKEQIVLAVLSFAAVVALVCACAGCVSSVEGGKSHADTSDASLVVTTPDGTRIESHQSADHRATTQPNVRSNTGQPIKLGDSDAGELGSISFEQARHNAIDGKGFIVAILFWIAAGVVWLVLRRPIVAGILAALGIGAALLPVWMGAACLIIPLVLLAYLYRHSLSQLVVGIDHARQSTLDSLEDSKFKAAMAEKHDDATKRIVKALKP